MVYERRLTVITSSNGYGGYGTEAKDHSSIFQHYEFLVYLDKGCCRLHRSLTSSVMDGSLSRRPFLGESPGVSKPNLWNTV